MAPISQLLDYVPPGAGTSCGKLGWQTEKRNSDFAQTCHRCREFLAHTRSPLLSLGKEHPQMAAPRHKACLTETGGKSDCWGSKQAPEVSGT